MGEMEFEQRELVKAVNLAVHEMNQSTKELRLSTPGGRFHVRWDEGGSATAMGQLAFFAEFLEVSGLFSRWVADCPLTYPQQMPSTEAQITPRLARIVATCSAFLPSITCHHCRVQY